MTVTERLCPVCGKPLKTGVSPFVCLRCNTLYHNECWDKVPFCVAYGCRSSKNEAVAPDLSRPVSSKCPDCAEESPREVYLCLKCGHKYPTPEKMPIFTSKAGWQADSPKDLVQQLSQHWESAVQHLYSGDLEHWLAENDAKELSEKAKRARTSNRQRSIGLEAFLQSTGELEPCVLSVSKESITVEGISSVTETVIDINNLGRGYLSGTISSDVRWITVDPLEFAGNKNRIGATIDLGRMMNKTGVGYITIESTGGTKRIEVKAKCIGISEALEAYNQGNYEKARTLCRRIIDSRTSMADATVLTIACCIHERNKVGAVTALRKLQGACVALPSEVIQLVFNWLEESDAYSTGVDRLSVYEALIPCADAECSQKLKKSIAHLALSKAEQAASSATYGGMSLWKNTDSNTSEAMELLQMAAEFDPALSSEAKRIEKRLQSGRNQRIGGLMSWVALIMVLTVVSGGVIWYVFKQQDAISQKQIETAIDSKNFDEALKELRIMCDNYPDEEKYKTQYAYVLIKKAHFKADSDGPGSADTIVSQAIDFVVGLPEASKAVTDELIQWAGDCERENQLGEARIRLEQAKSLSPQDKNITLALARVEPRTTVFWQLYSMSTKTLGKQSLSNYKQVSSLAKDAEVLKSLGAEVYDSYLMVNFEDLIGDGQRELTVCGTNNDAKTGKALGKLAIYKLNNNTLSTLYSKDENKFPILSNIQVADLTGGQRGNLVISWWPEKASGETLTQFVGCKDMHFISENLNDKVQVRLKDCDKDGRTEIWVPSIVGKSTGIDQSVSVYTPYFWNEPGFVLAKGDFSEFFNQCIKDFEEQIEKSPYPKDDPRSDLYKKDRLKAIGTIEGLIKKTDVK